MQFALKTKISTPKYRDTRSFYERVFGMSVAEEWDEPGDRGVILALPEGRQEAFLEVYHVDEPASLDGLSLQFRVESLAAFLADLPKDVRYEGPTPRPWGSTYLYLKDPSDVQIIVYEGGL